MTRVRVWLRWLFTGRHRWGYVTSEVSRYGAHTIEVHIYPPDLPPYIRGCLHLVRHWFRIAVVVAIASASLTVHLVPLSWQAVFAIKAVAVLAAISTMWHVTSEAREGIKTIAGRQKRTEGDPPANYLSALHCWARLRDLEYRLDRGMQSWEDFQSQWAAEYSR